MNTYTACLSLIQRERYSSKEEMAFKLNIFLLNNQLTQAQYDELITQLNT